MTPAARYAAAIDILDLINAGEAAERCLTTWARQNRFAGSKDRAAIRDHVYDVLRARRSLSALGAGETGRALVLGLLRRDGIAPEDVFGAGGYGPEPLSHTESSVPRPFSSVAEACDIPDWLWPRWVEALGDAAEPVARLMQARAPVSLRVNLSRASRDDAVASLVEDGIEVQVSSHVKTGLEVTGNPRKVAQSDAYRDGLVEVQDIASQMAIDRLPLSPGDRVLDYCAGGGGKTLAMADRAGVTVTAHDIDPARTTDIAPRAKRANVSIECRVTRELAQSGPYDLVLCDAPCSGSGTWRRAPQAKWTLTGDKLLEYNALQSEVLVNAKPLVRAGGILAYATCSVLNDENDGAIDGFLANNPGWTVTDRMSLQPDAQRDGFFLAILHNLR